MSEPKPLLAPLAPPKGDRRLMKDGRLVADRWRTLAAGEEMPIDGHAIVPLARWRAEQAALPRGVALGILVAPGDLLEPETDDLARLAVIALEFPKFADGRAYSTARRLRETFGWRGELRATGDVLIDQIPLMLRAGFDAFEIVHAPTIAAIERGLIPAVLRIYQRSTPAAAAPAWIGRRAAG